MKEKIIRTKPQVPCYNEEIAEAKRQRRNVERLWRRLGLATDFVMFKEKKNCATYVINIARKIFNADFIDSNSGDQGKLFRGTKELLAPDDCLSFPDYSNNQSLADDISVFFCSKICNIQTELDHCEVTMQDRAMVLDDPVDNVSQSYQNFGNFPVKMSFALCKGRLKRPVALTLCNYLASFLSR